MRDTALFLASFAVLTAARPDVVQTSYDNVNGNINAQTAFTDNDGNTAVKQASGSVNSGTEFVENNNAPDDSVSTVTGSFTQSSSSLTKTIDEDGNETTAGQDSDLSGVYQGKQVNDNGNVYGDQTLDVTQRNTDLQGVNGVNEIQNDETNVNLQRAKGADGTQSYEDHVDQTSFI